MTGEAHVTLRVVADLADGLLSGRRAAEGGAHLAACPPCRRRADELGATVAALAQGPLPAPPRAAVRAVKRSYRRAQWAWALRRAAEWVGELVYDQRVAPVAALRSGPGETRRLLWAFGEHELDACVTATGHGADLLGQVSPASGDADAEGEVLLYRDGKVLHRVALAEGGRFTFRGLAPGTYALAGTVDGHDFALPPFVVEG